MKEAYKTASDGLIEGGCDALLIETTQDLLQAKAATNGARAAINESKKDIVLIAQVTIETNGTMLMGCLLYTSPSPRDRTRSRMPSSA